MVDGDLVSHDFDFLFGEWTVSHQRLRNPLGGEDEWRAFVGTMTCHPILGGLGNIDEFFLPTGEAFGSTLRLFDTVDHQWSLHWSSSRTGRLDPPVRGTFDQGIGVFYGDDDFDGRRIRVRFVWDDVSPTTARWQQAFSADQGASWETNWIMTLSRGASAG